MTARSDNSTNSPKTVAINEALLNEIKGNIFEFSVGRELSRHFGREVEFLQEFGDEGVSWLSPYETYLRTHHPALIATIARLSKALSGELIKHLSATVPSSILVVGKRLSGSQKRGRAEADLQLIYADDEKLDISLKLCKAQSFVNTKSGGVKSFLSEYFDEFIGIEAIQSQLSHQVDHTFQTLGEELYEGQGLDWTGSYDDRWTHSKLPGELPAHLRERVLASYAELAGVIYKVFKSLYERDPIRFKKMLMRLIGHSSDNLIQAICFHAGERDYNYTLKGLHIASSKQVLGEFESFELLPYKVGLSSFEMQLETMRLQIRVKPMNTFTSPSYKINCSVKHNC